MINQQELDDLYEEMYDFVRGDSYFDLTEKYWPGGMELYGKDKMTDEEDEYACRADNGGNILIALGWLRHLTEHTKPEHMEWIKNKFQEIVLERKEL